jgi:hypothetical protein
MSQLDSDQLRPNSLVVGLDKLLELIDLQYEGGSYRAGAREFAARRLLVEYDVVYRTRGREWPYRFTLEAILSKEVPGLGLLDLRWQARGRKDTRWMGGGESRCRILAIGANPTDVKALTINVLEEAPSSYPNTRPKNDPFTAPSDSAHYVLLSGSANSLRSDTPSARNAASKTRRIHRPKCLQCFTPTRRNTDERLVMNNLERTHGISWLSQSSSIPGDECRALMPAC